MVKYQILPWTMFAKCTTVQKKLQFLDQGKIHMIMIYMADIRSVELGDCQDVTISVIIPGM